MASSLNSKRITRPVMADTIKGAETMESESKGVVVPFRRVPRPGSPGQPTAGRLRTTPSDAGGAAAAHPSVDGEVNAEWDLLIRLATEAWSWRDPESLDLLEHTVSRLRNWIGHDWAL
jgi:hypothetical protein